MAQGDDTLPWTPQALGPAASGMRRRQPWAESAPVDMRGDWEKERQAALTRVSAEPDVLRGLYNRLTGDDAAAEAAYGRALQTQQRAAEQDSNVSTSWRDWGSVGDAAAGVRKVLTGSAPDMALALGSGGIGRGLARRTIGNIERRAAVQQVEQRLANEGIDSMVGRKVAENAARKPVAAAASSQVAQAQFQDAIDRTGADLVRRASGAQGRIDAAGRAGFIAGSTAGAFPGIAAQDTQELSQTDREGTLRMLPYQIGQAALEPLVEARLAGRALANPYVKEALQEGVGATRGALSKLPGRIAKETVHNVATEAGTEGMQALLQTAGQRAGRGEDPLAFTGDDWAGALDQAIVGGLAGGAMGGSVEAVNASVPAVVDAAGRTVRAGADAGRWAWDKTGGVRQALRERIRAAAEKRRSPLDAMDGGADPGAQDAPADLGARAGAAAKRAVDTAGTLFDKAKQGLTSAAQRFRGTQDDLTQADELDAQANGAMDWLQANVFDEQGQPPAARHPYTSKATSPLQAWALSKMNPAFLDTLSETEATQLGQAVEKYAHNGDLTGAEHRLLRDAIAVPDSGLSRDMLNATALVAERITQPKSKAFKDAEGNAPHLARPRGSADDMVALAQDPGGADVVGLDVAASDSQDSAARLTNDWNSGFSEQTATDGIAPIDQLHSLRTSLTAMEARLGKQEARASAEYQALRTQGEQLRQQLRDRLESGVVFTRNDASDASRAFWARKTAEQWAVPLKDPKEVVLKDGKRTIKQPQVVDLQVVVGRALAALNAEGTPHENIPMEAALARGLSDLATLGYRINFHKMPTGELRAGGQTLKVTPKLIRKIVRHVDRRAYGPWPERKGSKPERGEAEARALNNEYGRQDDASMYESEPTDENAFLKQEYAQGARKPPPGARAPDGSFVPSLEAVSDVSIKSPFEKHIAAWRKERRIAQQRGAPPAVLRNINVKHGQKIGAALLAQEASDGKISPKRYDAEMRRLKAPNGTQAIKVLTRALRGDFDNISVRHPQSDPAERARDDAADPPGLRVIDKPEPREFVKRTAQGAERRAAADARADAAARKAGREPAPSSVPAGAQQTGMILRAGREVVGKPREAYKDVLDVQQGTKRDALGHTYPGATVSAASMAPQPKTVATTTRAPKEAPKSAEPEVFYRGKPVTQSPEAPSGAIPKDVREAVAKASKRVRPDAPTTRNGEYVNPPEAPAENRATANKADARSKAMDKARDAKNVPPVEAAATKPKRRVVLPKTSRYAAKDQAKSDRANKFIGRGAPGSSTAAYAKAWGDRANVGEYSPGDSVFISVNGNRPGALSPPWPEIKKAMSAGATLITDVPADRNRSFNSGERAVAAFLDDNGYFEESPGVWVRERASGQRGQNIISEIEERAYAAAEKAAKAKYGDGVDVPRVFADDDELNAVYEKAIADADAELGGAYTREKNAREQEASEAAAANKAKQKEAYAARAQAEREAERRGRRSNSRGAQEYQRIHDKVVREAYEMTEGQLRDAIRRTRYRYERTAPAPARAAVDPRSLIAMDLDAMERIYNERFVGDAAQNDELTAEQTAEDVTNELRRMFRGRTAGRSVIVHEGTDAIAALREAGVTDATIANAMFSYSDTQKLPEQTVRDFATLINGKVDANGLPYIQRDTKTSAQVQDIARALIKHVSRTGNGGLVPEADGAKLSVRGFLRDEDTGEAIDPKDTAEHYRLSDIGRRVAQAMNSGTLTSALQHEAEHIHSTREAALAEAADVLYAKVRSGALPTDAARALIAVSKFTAFTVEHADGTRTTTVAEISAANRHIPSLTPDMAKALITELKTGVGIKQAFRNAAIAEADASAARRAASGKHGWVKYSKGGDHLALNADAANTGWCTGWSDDSVAAQQLSAGDFWIYFDHGDPQIAIRTEDGVVAEVRGRLEGQRLPEKYADIAEAHIEGESSLNGARFLQGRKKKKALRSFLRSEGAMTVEQAGLLLTTEIAEDGTVKHYVAGDDWNENAVDATRLPPGGLLQADGTWLGNLSLPGRAALPEGVTRVSGDLHAHALTSAPLLERVDGDMYAHALTSAPSLARVGGGMSTYALTSAPRLESIGGDVSAGALTSAPLLESVGRGMSTYALTSAPRLARVGGGMSTYALTSAPLLESIGGDMYAHALTSAPRLESIGGDMSADSLTSAPLLERVDGDMYAPSLTSAPRLARVDGDMSAGSLTSAPLLESVGGRVYAPNLPAEQTALPARQFSHFDEDDDLPFSSRADGAIQGFVYNGAAHLVAGNIPAGDTRGVLLHEIGVHLGSIQSVLGPQRFASAAAAVESWVSGSDPMAKTIAEAAARRANGNKEELIAYAVEEAVNRGIAPSAETVVGRWLRAVMAAFHRAIEKLTGSRLKEFSPQDLVDVAYGIAVRGGRQRQNGPAPAQSDTQNDELTPEQSDAIDAGAKSASSDGRHDLKAERSMLNTILGMLGVTEQIGALRTLKDADERGNKGGSYARRSRTVSINPNLHGAERVEVLMHELGHHIIWNEIAKYVEGGFDALQGMTLAESIDVLAKGNPKLYAALRKDFDQWNANGRPSQSPTHRHLRRVVNGVDRVFKDDAQAFHEWFADNIARSLAGKRPVVGVVGKFFAKIATQLRKAWSVISATPSLKPAPSVDAWVKQMLNANVAAVKEATGQAAPQAKAEATVRGAATAQAAKAGPIKYTMENMDDLIALIETVLPVESRRLLDRVFARVDVMNRLLAAYSGRADLDAMFGDPKKPGSGEAFVKRMLDHPSQGASARVAFGYLAWQDGLLKTGPQGQNALLGLSDSVLRLFGAAGDGALAQRTLYDIQTGAVQRFKDAGKIYSARDLAARNGNNFQRALNWVNRMVENSPASNALAAFWTGNNTRMRESGIPALRTLATMLDRPQGSVGESNPGLITNIRVQTARWNRQMRDALEPLTDRQQLRALRALQRRAKAGDKAYDALPENARAAVDTIREMFRDAYRYQREAGYTEDDLGHIRDYMPVIMDVRNENARAKLTALYSKPEYARDVAIAAGFVKPDEKGLYDGAEIKAVTEDPLQMAKAVEYLVRAAANDGQTPPPAGAAGRFHFRHQNTQLSAFIYRHGNPDDIKTLASLQTRDPGEVFGRYFAPMVRWSEMARMFGEPEQVLTKHGDPVIDPATGREVWRMNPRAKLDRLLEKVKQQGGTDADTAFADNAVRAALGVYGADGSPTIAAVSPWAAEKLKGRKAQSVIEGVQAYQNVRLLVLALLSNIVDPVGIAVRTGGEFNDAWAGFKEGMGFVRAALSKDPQAAKRMLKELEDIDVSEDVLPALAANPVFEGGRTGKARAVNDFVFKLNGVQTWVTATRVMAMYAGHKFLLRHKQQPNDHSTRYLQELGLQPTDIVEDPNNPGKVEINDKTRAALRQFVDEAILRPNSQQAPLWMSDPYMGIVMQYKMFAYAIWDQIGGRIGREMTQGNMRVVAAALMYLPVIIMAELVREMVQTAGEGDDRRKDWGALEYTKLAADRSGLLGPQYQIMGDIKGDIDRARLPGTSQLGPTINQGNNVLDALQGRRNRGKEFESALPGSPLYRKWNDDMGEGASDAAAAA